MPNNLVSIILCTCGLKTIHKKVIPSIKNQTHKDIELIVVENSKDKENNNIMRNRGFSRSTGKFIFIMDEDIILHKDCIEKMMYSIGTTGSDFSYCDYDRTGRITGIQYGKPFCYETLKKINYISTMSLLKRSVFPGFDPEIKRLQDWDLFLTICENGGIGSYINEVLFLAIYDKEGITTRGPDDWRKSAEIVKIKHNLI